MYHRKRRFQVVMIFPFFPSHLIRFFRLLFGLFVANTTKWGGCVLRICRCVAWCAVSTDQLLTFHFYCLALIINAEMLHTLVFFLTFSTTSPWSCCCVRSPSLKTSIVQTTQCIANESQLVKNYERSHLTNRMGKR